MESVDYLCQRVKDVINEDPAAVLDQISGLVDTPLMALEKAVKPLVGIVPEVEKYADMSVQFSRWVTNVPQGCGRDGIAAINLLTREWADHKESLHHLLNERLRDSNRQKLKPFLPVLKLLLNGLHHLPVYEGVLWRGVNANITDRYPTGEVFAWQGFSSCVGDKETEEGPVVLGDSGERTFFCIQTSKGHAIGQYAEFQTESEVMLTPGLFFEIGNVIDAGDGLTIVELHDTSPLRKTMDYPI
ncbi:uncharacterized protein LOC135475894 [Liolophura sinensis]|uniref:uncharacterized protein LOC135475894 n=1 Tax=Liolophura sinensis TaxID=3198878 RepID=UPI0031594727